MIDATLLDLLGHEPGLLREPRRLEGYLRDLCPEDGVEIRLLFLAYRDGIAHDLHLGRDMEAPQTAVNRLASRFHLSWRIEEVYARGAVETWGRALGLLAAPPPAAASASAASVRATAPSLAAGAVATRSSGPASPASAPPASSSRRATGTALSLELGGGVKLNLVYIRGGTFLMGSPDSEAGRSSYEGPQTRVTLTKDFWLGETQVTQAQYQAVMGTNPSYFKGDGNLPVEHVSWNDAMEFCKKLTKKVAQASPPASSPLSFTLPTEAQWEYACRAGTTTRYSFGDSDSSLGDYAWYGRNSGRKTQPVKTKKPNPWGLYDMHGNVREWCSDWYADKLPGGSMSDPVGASSGSFRVVRGGGWGNGARFCRSAGRGGHGPGDRANYLGFRVLAAVQ